VVANQSPAIIPDIQDLDVSKPYSGFVRVTPAGAAWALGRNANIRRLIPASIKDLVGLILNGEWQNDHPACIAFDVEGKMRDGQHRMMAAIEASKTIIVRCICGMRTELVPYIDTGKVRQLRDRVVFSDDHNINMQVCKIINTMKWIRSDKIDGSDKSKVTPVIARQIFEERPDAILFGARFMTNHKTGISRASVGVALMEMWEIDSQKAEEFAMALQMGSEGNIQPARKLWGWLLENKSRGGSAELDIIHSKCVYAMSAYLKGREITKSLSADSWSK
jgi:hypothetical protein